MRRSGQIFSVDADICKACASESEKNTWPESEHYKEWATLGMQPEHS